MVRPVDRPHISPITQATKIPMNNKIKVLECIRQGQIGGGESHLLSLVENLDREQYDPFVLSFTEGPMVAKLQALGIRTRVIHSHRPFDMGKWRKVRKLMQAERPELIHAHGTRACSNTLWAARSLGIPLVYTIHGWSFHDDQVPLVRKLRVLGEKYLTSRSSQNIAVSSSNLRSGQDLIPGLRAEVIPNGIDLARFSPWGSFTDIRRELGIPEDALLILFIARFTSHKQPLALIRAFGEIDPILPKARLLMVGDGDQKTEGQGLARDLKLDQKIYFQDFRQDVPDILAAADIFVLPSLWEGLPIGLIEAMAMGKAVIASQVDGTKEIVDPGKTGLLVPPRDISSLSGALTRLGQDPDLRKRLGTQAMDRVRQQFDAGRMTREIERLYSRLISRGPGPDQVSKIIPHGI
jgi:glycosyltransferase involved in cell wall biosynthesis